MRQLWILFLVVVLAACSGSGSGGGSGGGSNGGPEGSTLLGSRALPSASVSVWALDPLLPASEVRFLVQATANEEVAAVEVLLGSAYQDAVSCVLSPEGDASWIATILLPDPLPEASAILVRVTFTDASVQESGVGDFVL